MSAVRTIAVILVMGLLASAVWAVPEAPPELRRAGSVTHLSASPMTRTVVDTVYLLGDPQNLDQDPQHNGTFQDAAGNPDWAGWITHDEYAPPEDLNWHVSTFQAVTGQYSMWCGTDFDGNPGYGNDWHTTLQFDHAVADPSVATAVTWTANLRIDSEPNYDYVYVEWCDGGIWQSLQQFDGTRLLAIDENITIEPGHYAGDNGDSVQLRLRFTSDTAWSDEDGLWDTNGACQYDDVRVVIDGVEVDFEDFEDGVSHRWVPVHGQQVWDLDFAQIWTDLEDLDPCADNSSPQVAFIDTGEQSPHSDGTPCISWCYGPGGWITYNDNVWGHPSNHPLRNAVISPVLAWPAGYQGAQLEFTAYLHETLDGSSPGMFAAWYVRSVNTGDPDDLESASWRSENFLYYGGPEYRRMQHDVSTLLEPDCTHAQVILQAWEYYGWGWYGEDGTPAPRFDNVQLKAYPRPEPVLMASGRNLFHDAVPTSGVVDMNDLASNSVRLDASAESNVDGVLWDHATISYGLVDPEAELSLPPQLQVRMLANPVFDAVRQLPTGFVQTGNVITGQVDGEVFSETCNFDLPDEGFFFPGDVLRYYVKAVSTLDGQQHTAILPADTTGFASPLRDARYAEAFEVRALPTINDADGTQPRILFWQHGHKDAGQHWWLDTFAELGLWLGHEIDLYATNAPGIEDADGLGGRVAATALANYDILIYSSDRVRNRILDDNDNWNDLQVLTDWLEQGGKRLLLTGDNVMYAVGHTAFAAEYLDAVDEAIDITPLIGEQVAPVVLPSGAGTGWLTSLDRWLVNGGCPLIRQVDAVTLGSGSSLFAEFAGPSGMPGLYPYAACWTHVHPANDTRTVALPYDLSAVEAVPGFPPPAGLTAAAALLDDILVYFADIALAVDTPAIDEAAVRCFPNPFNPMVTIRLELPSTTAATVDIVDVRGRQVRRIVAAELPAGVHDLVWDGADEQGRATASGVYFARVRMHGESQLTKLTLVR